MASLSVIIVAKNESHNIVDCVQSCAFADEILVLDSGSTDGTPELARQAGAKVIETDWPGFGVQKQRALSHAKCDWVLSIDADERISPALKIEIAQTLQNPQADGYRLPRLSSFCGTFIHHGGWRPDRNLRLAQRHLASFTDHMVHERMLVQGKVSDLTNDLIHHSYRDLNDVMNKMDRYSTAGATDMARADAAPQGLTQALLHGFWAFVRTYMVRAGFLDGAAGLMLAIYNAECTYYKYLKYRELQNAAKR
jgi:glycosyltransferase involved in cell wall biosynthesis